MSSQDINKRKARPSIEDRFDIPEDALVGTNRALLQSALYSVVEKATGAERLLRVWRKTGTPSDDELRQLWAHERRQVQRLMATAIASDVIVDVLEFVEDNIEFGVVLENAGQPLSRLCERANDRHWVRNLATPRNRSLLWRNLARVAKALGILHTQGIIHGCLMPERHFDAR